MPKSPTIKNFALGKWVNPKGEDYTAHNAINGDIIGVVSNQGLNYPDMMEYARKVGGTSLRKMTFPERGRMLKALALYLTDRKKAYYKVSYWTGATKLDSWIDIDGGIGNLFANASLRRQFADQPFHIDGDMVNLSKNGTFVANHIMVPKHGVAIHINAFNFPVWGMLEKAAVNWLAGVPCIIKPSEMTSYLTQVVVEDIVASGILPQGSIQLANGSGIGILDHGLMSQDVVTFTGSASTGRKLKVHPAIIEHSVPFNMEADSLNAAILGPDVETDSPEFELFIKEVRREMTVKCGQKCTAVRRIIVPNDKVEMVQLAISAALKKTTIGDPQIEGVRMGSLVNRQQLKVVREQIMKLAAESDIVYGDVDHFSITGGDTEMGAFIPPVLLFNPDPLNRKSSHEIEAFGPVSTIMGYADLSEASEIANMGKGSLVSTICTYNDDVARQYIMESGAYHGRILILNRESAVESTGHGSPMPLLVHGGPGRAGGGEEMGGMRGVNHYLQRVAVQGTPTSLTQVTQQYQYGGQYITDDVHPFRKYFEDLKVGETWITHKHTVTETDITNFANVSGDNFYAHMDDTSLEGTIFEQRVAHGYFVLSKAAGLFVEPRKGPVLLNYGLEECRFTKPVYPGMTIGVRLTAKEKTQQEPRENEPLKGIVKWLVDVYDETGETVAIATILTMVANKPESDQELANEAGVVISG